MSNLEEYLIEEEILEKFLGNVDFSRFIKEATLDTAFFWQDTEEGGSFWYVHYKNNRYTTIMKSRIEELIEERIPRFRGEVL